MAPATETPSKFTAATRGLAGRCPHCGQGKLLRNYLKPVERCSVCGEPYGHLRADDAPPWLTILVVGHIVIPAVLHVEQTWEWPMWLHMAVWPLLALVLTLILLPRFKGLILGIMWSTGAHGDDREEAAEAPPLNRS